jgi:hypothetical protein
VARKYRNDLFSSKIIITIPPMGTVMIALALLATVGVDVYFATVIATQLVTFTALAVTFTSATLAFVTRRQVRNLRYEARRVFSTILTDDELATEPETVSNAPGNVIRLSG